MSLISEYSEAMRVLLQARKDAGGHLPQERESKYVGKCDDLWHRMSRTEQE